MILKNVIVLFASLVFGRDCILEDVVPNVAVATTAASNGVVTSDVLADIAVNIPGKGEKLEEEIEQIGKQMQPGPSVVQQETAENTEIKINDEFDLKQKIENFTSLKLKTTEKVVVVAKEQDTVIEGDGLDHDDGGPEPDDAEQLRSPNDSDFVEFSDALKDRKAQEHPIEEELSTPQTPENPEPPEKSDSSHEYVPVGKPEKPFVPEVGFGGASSNVQKNRFHGKEEDTDTDKEEVGPTRPPPRYGNRESKKPDDVVFHTAGVHKEEIVQMSESSSTTESPEKAEFNTSDLPREASIGDVSTKPEALEEDVQEPQRPEQTEIDTTEVRPTEVSQSQPDNIPKKPDSVKTNQIENSSDLELLGQGHGKYDKDVDEEGKTVKDKEDDWISWDVVHFLLLLSPYDEDEVTWWTIIFEAVKCSLRNCPSSNSHWNYRPIHLPRVTRHRRQDSHFDPEAIPTTTKPCPCRNFENYFEKLYESIGDRKKNNNSTM